MADERDAALPGVVLERAEEEVDGGRVWVWVVGGGGGGGDAVDPAEGMLCEGVEGVGGACEGGGREESDGACADDEDAVVRKEDLMAAVVRVLLRDDDG